MTSKLALLLLAVVVALVSTGCAISHQNVGDCDVTRDERFSVDFKNSTKKDLTFLAEGNWSFDKPVTKVKVVRSSTGEDSTYSYQAFEGPKAITIAPGFTYRAWLKPRTPYWPYTYRLYWLTRRGTRSGLKQFTVNTSRHDSPTGWDSLEEVIRVRDW